MDLTPQLESAVKLLHRWLTYRVYADRIPGLSFGIVYKDKVLFSKGYGFADIEEKKEASETTCYRIASFSKIFTALAVLHLFEQKKLHLDDHVQDYLPWCTSEAGQITIRQLLTHTSGIDRDGDTPHWNDFNFPSREHIQQHIAEGAMIYTPAEHWKYSNMGYTLLGEIVGATSGVSYETYVTEHVLQPLGMRHSAPTLTEAVLEHLAQGYSRNLPERKREPFPRIATGAMASATGFSSNVVDLCQFLLAQLNGDTRLLKDETKREMRRIQWLCAGIDSDWCLGYETWKINNQRIYGHGGSFQGYKSRFGIDTERSIGAVILTNAIDAPAGDLLNGVLHVIDHLITNFDGYAAPAEGVQPEQPDRYEGCYRSIWGDIEIVAINGSLLSYDAGSGIPTKGADLLRYDKDHQFKIASGSPFGSVGETVKFEFDDQGNAQRVWVGPNPFDRLPSKL